MTLSYTKRDLDRLLEKISSLKCDQALEWAAQECDGITIPGSVKKTGGCGT